MESDSHDLEVKMSELDSQLLVDCLNYISLFTVFHMMNKNPNEKISIQTLQLNLLFNSNYSEMWLFIGLSPLDMSTAGKLLL